MILLRCEKITHTALLLILAVFFLHGCARHHPPRHLPKEPIGREQEQIRPEHEQLPEAIQEEGIEPSHQDSMRQQRGESVSPGMKPQKGPAQALFRDAEQAIQKGQFKRAEMLLERALRVEPRNGWYWHAMGRVQFEQGFFDQARQFFLKSNSLAGSDADLKQQNRLLLEKVRRTSDTTNAK
jgi:predicted Zn-dependent protease